MRLHLLHKLTLLVAVPLIFELVYVTALSTLYVQLETKAEALAHSRAVITVLDNISRSIYQSVFQQMMKTGKISFRNTELEPLLAILRPEVASLKSLTKSDPAESAVVDRMLVLVDRIYQLSNHDDEPSVGFSPPPRAELLRDALAQLSHERYLLAGMKAPSLKSLPAEEQSLRNLVKLVALAGVAVSVILTFALVFSFRNAIVTRLSVIMDNTRRVASKQPLNRQVAGDDEIASVDRCLHDMATSLEQAAETERQAQQLKQDFLAMVSHDLRTPISSTVLFLEMLAGGRYGQLSEEACSKTVKEKSNLLRLVSLSSNLLDGELIDSGKLKLSRRTIKAQSLLNDAVMAVEALAHSKQLSLETSSSPSEILLFADEDRIVQVLVNLLSNAVRFSPPGAVIKLSARQEAMAVTFTVIDQGPGIAETDQSLLFQKYSRAAAQSSESGFGLGLALCKDLIELHGGTIGVASAEGQGTTFSFTIPLDDQINA